MYSAVVVYVFYKYHLDEVSESCSVMSDSLQPHGLYSPWNSPGQNTGVGSLFLLQGIFPTEGSNPGLWHFGQNEDLAIKWKMNESWNLSSKD